MRSHCMHYLHTLDAGRYDDEGGTTKLDRYRVNLCRKEIENVLKRIKINGELPSNHYTRIAMAHAYQYLAKVRKLREDVSWISCFFVKRIFCFSFFPLLFRTIDIPFNFHVNRSCTTFLWKCHRIWISIFCTLEHSCVDSRFQKVISWQIKLKAVVSWKIEVPTLYYNLKESFDTALSSYECFVGNETIAQRLICKRRTLGFLKSSVIKKKISEHSARQYKNLKVKFTQHWYSSTNCQINFTNFLVQLKSFLVYLKVSPGMYSI